MNNLSYFTLSPQPFRRYSMLKTACLFGFCQNGALYFDLSENDCTVFAIGALFRMMTIKLFFVRFLNMLCCFLFCFHRFFLESILLFSHYKLWTSGSFSGWRFYLFNSGLVIFCFCGLLLFNLEVEMSRVFWREVIPHRQANRMARKHPREEKSWVREFEEDVIYVDYWLEMLCL